MPAHTSATAQRPTARNRARDGLSISTGYAGRKLYQAELSSSAAETFETALHALTDPPADGDTRTASRRRADALVRMAELAMAQLAGATPSGRARPSAIVVVDWATLTGERWGRIDGQFTGTLHRSDVERLLCDCTVSRVVTGADGLPLDVGRSRRTIPPQIDRARQVRDDGCRFPGCTRPHGWTVAHHVIHWKDGGRTVITNIVSLCDHHHHVVHLPGWSATFDGHTFTVTRPDGMHVT